MISVDTSVVVRYLVGTPTDQAARAAALVDSDAIVGVSIVVLVETAHVLRTQYGISRSDVLDALLRLVWRSNMRVIELSTDDVTDALVRARGLPDRPIPDAFIAISARAVQALPIHTFDRAFHRLGVATAEP